MADARFRKIDAAALPDHTRLLISDKCFYLYELTSGAGYAASTGNSLISNLKKPVSRAHLPEYAYKKNDILRCSKELGEAIASDWLKSGTLVPIPPSKAKTDPAYDDRMTRICRGITKPFPVDVRELVVQTQTTRAAHESPNNRLSVAELQAVYAIEERLALPAPKAIAIMDDVLTAGTHFRAASAILASRFPGVPIYGMFIARRIFPTAAGDEFL